MGWFNLESLAVLLSLGYLVLAVRGNSMCWYLAFFSTAIYVYIFAGVSLYMESFLNVYYMGMAVYGWYQWKRAGLQGMGCDICKWPLSRHLFIIIVIILFFGCSKKENLHDIVNVEFQLPSESENNQTN